METIFDGLGLEPEIVLAMTDGDLTRLGVSTMEDRIRLQRSCKDCTSTQSIDSFNLNTEGASSSSGPSQAFVASEFKAF